MHGEQIRVVFLVALTAMIMAKSLSAAPVPSPKQSEQPRPRGDVVLTVLTQSGERRTPGAHRFDQAMLEEIGSTFIQTSTPWTNGIPLFRGVLVRDLLRRVGTEGKIARAVALNDYRLDIPLSDFFDYPVLLAYEMNGKPLPVRDKGPIWLIYPLDQFSELRNRMTERKMVWQLIELQIK